MGLRTATLSHRHGLLGGCGVDLGRALGNDWLNPWRDSRLHRRSPHHRRHALDRDRNRLSGRQGQRKRLATRKAQTVDKPNAQVKTAGGPGRLLTSNSESETLAQKNGRTSTGTRHATTAFRPHSTASSMSATSRTQKPPMCSLVSK